MDAVCVRDILALYLSVIAGQTDDFHNGVSVGRVFFLLGSRIVTFKKGTAFIVHESGSGNSYGNSEEGSVGLIVVLDDLQT